MSVAARPGRSFPVNSRWLIGIAAVAIVVAFGTGMMVGSALPDSGRQATPPVVTSPTPLSSPSPTPSASTAGYPVIVRVTDNFGHTWLPAMSGMGNVAVTAGVTITFNTYVRDSSTGDAYAGQMQFTYTSGELPNPIAVLCGWGGPTCSWTPAANQSLPYPALIWVVVRHAETGNRMDSCDTAGAGSGCDDLIAMRFTVVAPASPTPTSTPQS